MSLRGLVAAVSARSISLSQMSHGLAHLATAGSVACLIWILSGWGLHWGSSKGAARPALDIPAVSEVASAISSRHLFGQTSVNAAVGESGGASYRLFGVAAGAPGKGSFAIIAIDSRPPQAFIEGTDIAAGVRLQRVLADRVELSTGGGVRVIELIHRPAGPKGPGQQAAGQ